VWIEFKVGCSMDDGDLETCCVCPIRVAVVSESEVRFPGGDGRGGTWCVCSAWVAAVLGSEVCLTGGDCGFRARCVCSVDRFRISQNLLLL
jgi:hypothetical protein